MGSEATKLVVEVPVNVPTSLSILAKRVLASVNSLGEYGPTNLNFGSRVAN